ncbi:MAG: site-specific integrase, partial [Verrucomicrobiota bacterium]
MARRAKSGPAAAPDGLCEPLDAFLAHLSLERGLSRLTVAAYESDLTEFARHCGRAGRSSWTEVVLGDLESWVKSMHRRGHAPASLARRLSAVRSLAAHLVRGGLRRDDFTELARGPRFRRRLPGRLTPEAAARIMTAPDDRT